MCLVLHFFSLIWSIHIPTQSLIKYFYSLKLIELNENPLLDPMTSCIQGHEDTILTKVWGSIDAIKSLVRVVTRSWCSTCLIEPLIPPRVDFKHEMLIPTKFVHYASETSMGLFENPFRMNLRLMKPCAVIKGTKWLRNYAYLIWKHISYAGAHPEPPISPFILYFPHHNYWGPWNKYIAMYCMNIFR